ncbi:transporter [Actimicrobium antarcticum]|uniref:Transporter n=1 Tax=Actimicrobium antarcticum TaxID=1051899 RepID=A0ABP7SU91_9BURK
MQTAALPNTCNAVDDKHNSLNILCTALLALTLATTVLTVSAATADTILSDQPGFTDSSDVVGRGWFQIETSIAGEHNRRDGVRDRTLSTPTLLRLGVTNSLELRLGSDGRVVNTTRTDSTSETQRGAGDLSLGMKWHISDALGTRPSIGVITQLDVDSGSPQFRGNGVRPTLHMPFEWTLPNAMSLNVMPGLVWDKKPTGERFASALLGVQLGKSMSDRLAIFTEVALPQIARAENGGSTMTIGAGLSYLLTNDTQVDTAFARGLNRNTVDTSWTVGLSTRF